MYLWHMVVVGRAVMKSIIPYLLSVTFKNHNSRHTTGIIVTFYLHPKLITYTITCTPAAITGPLFFNYLLPFFSFPPLAQPELHFFSIHPRSQPVFSSPPELSAYIQTSTMPHLRYSMQDTPHTKLAVHIPSLLFSHFLPSNSCPSSSRGLYVSIQRSRRGLVEIQITFFFVSFFFK
ncbi:hypothetical protein BYT27DRAFT_6943335 [Phlegmacium glaucopus]|nr:hypothetical protein BYT27DRAFT_6943335 [Phlegmacium glaucopus]